METALPFSKDWAGSNEVEGIWHEMELCRKPVDVQKKEKDKKMHLKRELPCCLKP